MLEKTWAMKIEFQPNRILFPNLAGFRPHLKSLEYLEKEGYFCRGMENLEKLVLNQ